MMLTLTLLLTLQAPTALPADTLHCRLTAGQGKQRCSVEMPTGHGPAACPAGGTDCRKLSGRKYQVWFAEQDGAHCKLSRKHADWTRKVTLKRKATSRPVGSCALSVIVE